MKQIRTRTRTGPPERKLRPSENTSLGGGSAHRDQSTGNFTANTMIQCINEIKQVEAEAAAKGEQPKTISKHDSSEAVPLPSPPQTRCSLCRICGYLSSWGFVVRVAGTVPPSFPSSSAAFLSASPHLPTEIWGKSFRSIFKQNRLLQYKDCRDVD